MAKVKVTFMLDEKIRTELRVHAAKNDKNISDTIEQAIKEFLEKQKPQ